MAWPDYFEIPKGTSIQNVSLEGSTPIAITTQKDMFCYSAQAMDDVLSAKRNLK